MAPRGRKPKLTPNATIRWDSESAPAEMDAEMGAEYERLVGVLGEAGTLERTDRRMVEMAARTQVLIARAYAEIARDGLTVLASNKTPMPHPMLAVINALTMRLKGLMHDLGLTPTSSKLAGNNPPAASSDDPLARLIADPLAALTGTS